MAATTRTPLCPVKVCPAPNDPFWHQCLICGAKAVEHQHVDPKRMGGSPSRDVPSNIVPLCHACHEKITLKEWADTINEREYIVVDRTKDYAVIARRALEPGTETDPGSSDSAVVAGHVPGSVPSKNGTELALPSEYTRQQAVDMAKALGDAREQNPWLVGDLLSECESRWPSTDLYGDSWTDGPAFAEYFRIGYPTLRNYHRVCREVDIETRERFAGLSFGHWQTLYKNPEREQWAKLAVDEGLSVSELRRRIKPPQPKPRRFTVDDLRVEAAKFAVDQMIDLTKDDLEGGCIPAFLDWLGGETA